MIKLMKCNHHTVSHIRNFPPTLILQLDKVSISINITPLTKYHHKHNLASCQSTQSCTIAPLLLRSLYSLSRHARVTLKVIRCVSLHDSKAQCHIVCSCTVTIQPLRIVLFSSKRFTVDDGVSQTLIGHSCRVQLITYEQQIWTSLGRVYKIYTTHYKTFQKKTLPSSSSADISEFISSEISKTRQNNHNMCKLSYLKYTIQLWRVDDDLSVSNCTSGKKNGMTYQRRQLCCCVLGCKDTVPRRFLLQLPRTRQQPVKSSNKFP